MGVNRYDATCFEYRFFTFFFLRLINDEHLSQSIQIKSGQNRKSKLKHCVNKYRF